MTRRLAVAAALGAAALAFAADDPNAPLAQAKEQLQSLKKDEAAQKAGTQSGVKVDLPKIDAPAQQLDLPAPRRDDANTSNNASDGKNWLLDGYEKLDGERGRPNGKRGDDRAGENQKPLDPHAPDYFLRLYERQRAERNAMPRELGRFSTDDRKSRLADPFAPFMKDWLANSPVRDALKDSLSRASPDTGMPPASEPVVPPSTTTVTSVGVDTQRAPNTNPFVEALGLPTPPPAKLAEVRTPLGTGQNQMSAPVSAAAPTPASTIYDLPERPKTDLKHTLPPPPSEDKKFFPQLKKF